MSKFAAILCAALAAAAVCADNQTPPPKSPAAPGPAAKPPGDKPSREKAMKDYLEKLTPEQRQKVLAAVKHVWEEADVKTARQQLKEAADGYKKTIRDAIEETDPDVRDLVRPMIERMIKEGFPQGGSNGRKHQDGPPRSPRLFGLVLEKFEALPADEKNLLMSVRERVADDPASRKPPPGSTNPNQARPASPHIANCARPPVASPSKSIRGPARFSTR